MTSIGASLTRLADFITEAGPTGRTRKEITAEHFQGHKKATEIDGLLDNLTKAGKITQATRAPSDGRGRATTVYTTARRPRT